MDQEGLDEKVVNIEAFINDTLKNDLQVITDARDRIYEQIAEYVQLKSTVDKLVESGITRDLKTQIDIGCNFYMQAVCDDASKILVAIGHGFFAEMTHEEALTFVSKKIASLEKRADHLSSQANYVKARIKVLLEGLNELQNISPVQEPQERIEL